MGTCRAARRPLRFLSSASTMSGVEWCGRWAPGLGSRVVPLPLYRSRAVEGWADRDPAKPSFRLPAVLEHLAEERNVFQRRLRRLERSDVGEEIRRLLIRQAGRAIARHRNGRSNRRRVAGSRRTNEADEPANGQQARNGRAVLLNE